MANDNLARLKTDLEETTTQRDAQYKELAENFSQPAMDKLSALQKMVATKTSALEEAEAKEAASSMSSEAKGDAEFCVVSLIRSGKSDRCVEVPAHTSVADLMHSLSWSTDDVTFKRRVGPGQTVEITDLSQAVGPGEHEIFIAQKVAGGI
jgi:hypothetical protein